MRSIPLFFTALLIGSLASCSPLVKVDIEDLSGSKFLELDEGGPFSDQTRFLLSDTELVAETYRHSEGTFNLAEQKRIPLNATQANRIWELIDKASIPSWSMKYHPTQLGQSVCDGIQWRIILTDKDRVFTSTGDNAYPSLKNVNMPTLEDNTYSRILDKLKTIITDHEKL